MTTDRELLRCYVEEESDDAFREIVGRHVDLVYGSALRQLCGNASLAEDVTQAVFTALAAKKKEALQIRHLTAWLYATTRFTVSHTVRTERRRQDREVKAQTMHAIMNEPESHGLPPLPPGLLDDVLASLDESDREAVLLRFFEGQPFAAIGSTLELSEDGARMRVTRALEKIRTLFARKGITSSATAVGVLLSQQVVAAPVPMAASVALSALTGTATLVATTAGTTSGFITLMTTTKTIGLAVAALALGYAGYQYNETANRSREIARLTQERDQLLDQLRQSRQQAATLDQRVARAERQQVELQQQLDTALTPKQPVSQPAPKPPYDLTARRAEKAKKLAQIKPLLEAGMPIKGALVVTVNGKAISYPVALIMGQETAIESDDGTYTLKPVLNPDGSIKYAITLVKQSKNDVGIVTRKISAPDVTQIPWDSFMITLGSAVIAFESDLREP